MWPCHVEALKRMTDPAGPHARTSSACGAYGSGSTAAGASCRRSEPGMYRVAPLSARNSSTMRMRPSMGHASDVGGTSTCNSWAGACGCSVRAWKALSRTGRQRRGEQRRAQAARYRCSRKLDRDRRSRRRASMRSPGAYLTGQLRQQHDRTPPAAHRAASKAVDREGRQTRPYRELRQRRPRGPQIVLPCSARVYLPA